MSIEGSEHPGERRPRAHNGRGLPNRGAGVRIMRSTDGGEGPFGVIGNAGDEFSGTRVRDKREKTRRERKGAQRTTHETHPSDADSRGIKTRQVLCASGMEKGKSRRRSAKPQAAEVRDRTFSRPSQVREDENRNWTDNRCRSLAPQDRSSGLGHLRIV